MQNTTQIMFFATTQAIFINEILRVMTNMRIQLLNDPESSAKGEDNETTPPEPYLKIEEDDENIKSLTCKQKCNFNAFERAVSKINIDRTYENDTFSFTCDTLTKRNSTPNENYFRKLARFTVR